MIWLCCSSWKILPFDILRLNAKVLYFIFGLIMGETALWGRPPHGGDRPQRGFIWGRPPPTRFYMGETAPNAVLFLAIVKDLEKAITY